MKIETTIYCSAHDLRKLCISEGWYTKGTNDQYNHLFDLARCANDMKALVSVSEDIILHSELGVADVLVSIITSKIFNQCCYTNIVVRRD